MISAINTYSNLIIAIFTVLLVIITGIYAYFTWKMTKIMAKQVIADIQIPYIAVGTEFLDDWFHYKLKESPKQIDDYKNPVKFKVLLYAQNKNSANGSIEKPALIVVFTDQNLPVKFLPKTTEYPDNPRYQDRIATDLGATIFVRGGEMRAVTLDYDFIPGPGVIKRAIESSNAIRYYAEFIDHLGKRQTIEIKTIKSIRENLSTIV